MDRAAEVSERKEAGMDLFKDKIAIVTGGASGIGKCVCEGLAGRGVKLVLADLNLPLAEQTAAGIKAAGGQVSAVKLDVTDHLAVQALVDQTAAEHGRLDYMFNNAGVVVIGEARDYSYADWRQVIDVDFLGVVNGVAAAYPLMCRQGFGHLVNTASAAGLIPTVYMASYTASKYGVVGLSHTLRQEGAGLGVKVTAICPGLIKTPIYESPTRKIDRDKVLEKAPQGMDAQKCARAILKGVERNSPTIVITAEARLGYPIYRLFPRTMLWIGGKFVNAGRRRFRVE
jgi:NAD(P)-dependent dehydrogenase (short-subunit alcohol dehydrogenase family)